MSYTRQEIEEMDPLVTYYETKKLISEKQQEFLGDLDLKALQSQLGSSSGSGASSGASVEKEEVVVEEVIEAFI